MKKKLIISLMILVIFNCGGPSYPEEIPKETPIEVDDSLEMVHHQVETVLTSEDVFNYLTDGKVRYYEQITPIHVIQDGEAIYIDGQSFRILEQDFVNLDSLTIEGYQVQAESGFNAGIGRILLAYKDTSLIQMEVEGVGTFSKEKPFKLNPVQERAEEKKLPKVERRIAIYTVNPGDNLSRIAPFYGMTVAELTALNNLKSSKIKVGQKLKVYAKN